MTRRIIGAAFVSLDGVVQAPGGPEEDRTGGFAHGGWMQPVFDEAVGHQVDTLFAGDFDLLLGRRTYEIFAAYWPFMPADNPIAAKFAAADKYVLTGSGMPLDWSISHRLADLDALARVKSGDGPDLVIQGSSTLYPQLLGRGLLDRVVLMIAPVTLGAGKRLFGNDAPAKARHADGDLRARRQSQDRHLRNTGTERSRAEAARAGRGGHLVMLVLFGCPFSSSPGRR